MFNELEIIKRLDRCSVDSSEKEKLLHDFQNLTNDEKQNFLLIMKNLKETYVIRNLEVTEDKNGKSVDYILQNAPYLTGIGEKYLKSKSL